MSFHWTICFQCSLNPFHKEIILPWKNLDSRQLASIIWRCLTWFIKFMIFFFKILHFDSFFPFLLRHASSTFFFFFSEKFDSVFVFPLLWSFSEKFIVVFSTTTNEKEIWKCSRPKSFCYFVTGDEMEKVDYWFLIFWFFCLIVET